MYDDYDDMDDYLDDLDDDLEDDYMDDDFDFEEEMIEDNYQMQVNEIDEYWDRENEYIINSGIYTEEEVQQILEDHNSTREEKKAEAREIYELEKERLAWDKEEAENERRMRREEREYEREQEREERAYEQRLRIQAEDDASNDYISNQLRRKPSFVRRAFTWAAAYHFMKKLIR